jgi:glycosyltransferase involved in cell wall biosynthesis
MNIHTYIISFNEEKILPFTLDYYSDISNKIFVFDNYSTDGSDEIYKKYPKVEVIKWDSNNEINELNYINIKSNEYKKYSRDGSVDWVFMCDADEFIYHPNLINKLKEYKSIGVTVAKTAGYEMASDKFPEYDGRLLPEIIKIGHGKMPNLSKNIIFDPNMDMDFGVGAHTFQSKNVVMSFFDEIKILHYKFLGKEYLIDNYKEREKRLSKLNKERKWGCHYSEIDQTLSFMDQILKSNKNVVD